MTDLSQRRQEAGQRFCLSSQGNPILCHPGARAMPSQFQDRGQPQHSDLTVLGCWRTNGLGAFSNFSLLELDLDEGERSEGHTSELQYLMRIQYAVFSLKIKISTT